MGIQVGDKAPNVKMMTIGSDGPEPVMTGDMFAGKKVAFFAVPGAFTPTCSAKHLPGFKEKAAELKDKGVELIACTSVNDMFVMKAWADQQDVDQDILMLADGNGEFAEAMGLVMDGTGFGMGQRSQRYSMIVNDGTVEQLNVEEGGEFRVSSADYMLDQL